MLLDEPAIERATAALVASLQQHGARAGDRVAVLAGICPEMVVARAALAAAGMAMVPLDPRLAPPELAYVLVHARPALVLFQPTAAVELAAAKASERILPFRRPQMVALERVAAPAVEAGAVATRPAARAVDGGAIGATLLYTSGTTGRPKGCVRTAEQEAARARELIDTYRITADDVHLVACPLAYSAPGILLRAARAAGAATALLPRFTPAGFLEAVAAARASLVFLVPTQLQRLVALPPEERDDADVSSLRAVVVAGAPMSTALRRAAVGWLGPGKLWEFYGSSETGTISVLRPEAQLSHPDSVGRPAPGVEVRCEHTADAPGEIFVRSKTVMSGYWNPVTGAVDWPGTDDGFVSVGDLGHLAPTGYLHLVDRLHDTIITGGVNVYPAEVERAISLHPDVEATVVIGLADPEWGQRVVALVVRADDSSLTEDSLRHHLRANLAPHKIPKQIGFVSHDEIPRTASGKPIRRAAAAVVRRAQRDTEKTPRLR
ncbi:MAG TPA: AMP-binding protein [Kofleriaceae bacterium]|nr:AMP-binding protein [Kofleriaceae bacterium]